MLRCIDGLPTDGVERLYVPYGASGALRRCNMPLTCPTCSNSYVDLLDHIRKKHTYESYTSLQLQPVGLAPCPDCGTACKGSLGIKAHQAKIHNIPGANRVSTQHRHYTNATQNEDNSPIFTLDSKTQEQLTILQKQQRLLTQRKIFTRQPQNTTLGALTTPSTENAPLANLRKRTLRSPSPSEQLRATRVCIEISSASSVASTDLESLEEDLPDIRDLCNQVYNSKASASKDGRNGSPTILESPVATTAYSVASNAETEDIYNATPPPSTKEATLGLSASKWNTQPPPATQQKTAQPISTTPRKTAQPISATQQKTAQPISTTQWKPTQPTMVTQSQPTLISRQFNPTTQRKTAQPISATQQKTVRPTSATSTTQQKSSRPTVGVQKPLSSVTQQPTSTPQLDAIQPPTTQQKTAQPIPATQQKTAQPIPSVREQHKDLLHQDLQKPSVQLLLAFSNIQIPDKKLHTRQSLLFIKAAERCANAFIKTPRERQLLHLLLLPRVLGLGLQKGKLKDILEAYPTTIPDPSSGNTQSSQPPQLHQPSLPPQQQPAKDPIQQAMHWLKRGFLGKAARSLVETTAVVESTEDTVDILLQKHPIGQPLPFNGTNPTPGQVITLNSIQLAIKSINKEKAPGLSGWTRPLLDTATSNQDSAFMKALRLLTDMIRQGTAPGSALLCASRLIPLSKKDGGIRPIAIGDMLYRVALKAILTTSFKPAMLLPNQLGVNSKGGVEPAIFMLEEAISGVNEYNIQRIASLDLSNAFNSISRTSIASAVATYAPTLYRASKWAYNNPSILVTQDGVTIVSAEGVRQGDPLAPLLFSLAIRPTLEHLQQKLPNATILAYLDDIYILNKDDVNCLDLVAKELYNSPVSLNKRKSNDQHITTLQQHGLATLGTYIGPMQKRQAFLRAKIDSLKEVISTLKDLPKQAALLLLRGSTHLLLRHLLRQLNHIGLQHLWEEIDQLIQEAVSTLASRSPFELQHFNSLLLNLPVKDGGLGIPSYRDTAEPLYNAAYNSATDLIQRIQPQFNPTTTPTLETAQGVQLRFAQNTLQLLKDTQSIQQEKSRIENTSYFSRQWLRVLPTQKQHQFTDSELTEMLRSRLLIPIQPTSQPCIYCGSYPEINHEDICKGANRRWMIRHNQITKAFISTCQSDPEIQVEEEPVVQQQIEGADNSTLLRADFSILVGTSRYYYDVQIVAINKDSAKEDAFSTLEEAAKAKQRKYKELGNFFHPLIFSAGGLMEKTTAQTYKGLQKLLGPIRAKWLDSQIAITLIKSRAIAAMSIAKTSS